MKRRWPRECICTESPQLPEPNPMASRGPQFGAAHPARYPTVRRFILEDWAAPVTIGANFDFGKQIALFQTTPRQPVSFNDRVVYDVRPDGQRFLILTQMKQAESVPMSVVLNWPAKLNK
jgi:hypothetical protein